MATRLALSVAAASVLVAIMDRAAGGALLANLLYTPSGLLHGKIWQILTYTVVYPLGTGNIFGFLISLYFLYMIGGQVEAVLGSRRFLGFFFAAPALAAILSLPVAYLLGAQRHAYPGLWAALGGLTIVFAHHFAHQPIYLMFVLPVQGRTLIYISFGILGLYAILGGLSLVLPPLFAMLIALAFNRQLFQPRRAWLRFRAWQIERKLKRRTGKFSVIDGDRKDEPWGRKAGKGDERGPWMH